MSGYLTGTEKREYEIAEWHRLHAAKEQEYLKRFDDWLAQGTGEAKQALCALAEQEGFIETFQQRSEMSYIINAINIWYRECDAGESPDIFDMAHSVAEIICSMNRIRFLIWELIFIGEEESEELLCGFLTEQRVSATMLLEVLDRAAPDRYQAAVKLAEVFGRRRLLRYQLRVLLYAAEICEGDETVLCALAELYMQAGRRALAQECVNQIKNASGEAERIRREYGL